MATFTNATILGINASSQFLGNETVRLRTVKAIDVEGFIDSRATNTDIEGVKETQNTISNLISSLNTSKTQTEEIIINGYNFGTGKILSANFSSAPGGATDNQILVGNWDASIEVYESGDSTLISNALDTLSISNANFLENFSESFSASRGDSNSYEFNHDVSLQYISGLQPNGGGGSEIINPISSAKTLAQGIFSQSLSSFNLALGIDNSYDYNSLAQNFFNETYDLENGTASFQKRFSLFNNKNSASEVDYSTQITSAFEMGSDGIAKVTERGEIKGRSSLQKDVMRKTLEAYVDLIDTSYTRCNSVYNSYKSYLASPTSLPYLKNNTSSLVNSIVSKSKSVNINEGTISYDVSYTDDLNIKNIDRVEEKTIDLSTDANITSVSEKGTITFRFSKFSQTPSTIIAAIPSSATVKTRCNNVYAKNNKSGTLRLLKNSSSYNAASFNNTYVAGGKSIEYSYEFTDDPEVVAAPTTFTKKQIKSSDAIGVVNTKVILFPNQPGNQAFVHFPDQTSVSTRTVSADAQMKRATTNNLTSFRLFKSASREIFNDMLLEGLKFFQDNPSFTTIDRSQIFVSDLSFNFDHENKLGGSLSITIIGSRNPADLRKIL